ncbi:MFS transporter [Longispora fulva]|uniref:MFS family permease n=1 Tax=Longispora fulva TaxID=619741 RepID=A0A8J7GP77_9ACTN|nr:MFS transporter [Longispora fulva]MBG6140842.1 MFS family permease [Longispora fulva]GIG60894.1 MFS transporter [Longispora fulva]
MQKGSLSLFRRRGFALLWTSGLISFTGDWLLMVALPIYVLKLTGSPAAMAGSVVASVTARLLFGTVAGVFVDRWDRKTVMIVGNLLQAAAMVPLTLVHNARAVPIVYCVVFLQGVIGQFTQPAEGAMLPRLVDSGDLTAANAMNALNNNLARLVGPALGGLSAAYLGLGGSALINGASFLVAAALVAAIPGRHRADAVVDSATGAPEERHFGREFTGGLALIRRSRVLSVLLLVLTIGAIGEGIMMSTFAIFVDVGLHGGAQEFGWLMSSQAVGGILGGLAGGWFAARWTPLRLLIVGLMVFGLVDLAIFTLPRFTPSMAPQIGLWVLVGVPAAVAMAALMTIIQQETPDAFMGRVFAVIGVLMAAGSLVGAGLAGAFTDRLGVVNILTVQAFSWFLAGVLVAVILWGHVRQPAERPDAESPAPVGEPAEAA